MTPEKRPCTKPQLSIIIPYGLSEKRVYLKERIAFKAEFYAHKSPKFHEVEFIFVEGFSSDPQPRLQGLIKRCKHRYLKDEKQQKAGAFSLGKCRNLGISHANADVVMVLDADCHLSKGLLGKILELIAFKDIANNPNAALFLPCALLTQGGNDILKQQSPEKWDLLVQAEIYRGQNGLHKRQGRFCKAQNELVSFVTPASSSFIMNKHAFLALGGFDESFVGHGYEDFDFMARVLFATHEFEKMPAFLCYDARNWDFAEFKGFRTLFALAGSEAAFYGLYIYHFWHDEPNQNGYFDNKDKNHKAFYEKLRNLEKNPHKIREFFEENLKNSRNLENFGGNLGENSQNLDENSCAVNSQNLDENLENFRLNSHPKNSQTSRENRPKTLQENINKKTFIALKSHAYKPYIYELKGEKFTLFFYPFGFLQMKISHSRFYRFFRKFKSTPEMFFRDSKKPFVRFLGRFWGVK